MASALALCGYDQIASQMINEQKLIQRKSEFERFIEQAEFGLKRKGYWDDLTKSKLSKGLEDLLHLLIQSINKVRCINIKNRQVLMIHSLNDKTSLIQQVKGKEHRFTFHEKEVGYHEILANHFEVEITNKTVNQQYQTIEMDEDVFNEFHHMERNTLRKMIEDQQFAPTLREFLRAFVDNNQEFNNVGFMYSEYVKDTSEFEQIIFFVPGDDVIWHLDYEMVNKNKLFIHPVQVNAYLTTINEEFIHFLE